jgi:photoactive yellow protein
MLESTTLTFDQDGLLGPLARASDAELDRLDFGVIGFDHNGVVQRYNALESKTSGLRAGNARGGDLFREIAPCMNNFLVAQRFDDARDDDTSLDATIDYVLTFRMRPVPVKLRLLASPGEQMRFVLVQRLL